MSEVGEATRIVLVDDDGVCLAMLARGLKRRGFEVCSYSDPRDAVARLLGEEVEQRFIHAEQKGLFKRLFGRTA